MGSGGNALVFATIFLCLFLQFPSQTKAVVRIPIKILDLANGVCTKSNDQEFCLQTLDSCPKISSVTNTKSLADVALEIARKETTNVHDFFNGMTNSKATNPAFKPALKQCADFFSTAVIFFNLKGLKDGTASYDVHNALDTAESCLTSLAESRVHIDSIQVTVQKWKKFYSIASAAVVAVENSS